MRRPMATSVLVPGVLALAAMAGMLDLAAQRHASSDEEAVREVVRAYVVAREARDRVSQPPGFPKAGVHCCR